MWSFLSNSDMLITLALFGCLTNTIYSLYIRNRVIKELSQYPAVNFVSKEAETIVKATIDLPTLMFGNFILFVFVISIAAYVPFVGACVSWLLVLRSKPFEVDNILK